MKIYQRQILNMVFFCFASGFVMAQTGDAGRESLFSIGVGSRALALGGATVAYPTDPSSYLSNPAGMKLVQQRALDFSLTTLFEGTQYNFLGYVHPTLSAGVFGIGFTRIGTGGIEQTEWDASGQSVVMELGEMDYWWGKLTLAYALNLTPSLSLGLNFNSHRQVLGEYSTNGFGLDAGLHYRFASSRGMLKNLYLGAMFNNAMSPRMRLGSVTETLPMQYVFGMAKKYEFGHANETSDMVFLFDYEKNVDRNGKIRLGLEYARQNKMFVRTGYDGKGLTFGGGLRFKDFQIDYSTSQIADALYFPRSHRFSIIYRMGETLDEQRQAQERERIEEVQARFNEQMDQERQSRVREGLRQGKEFLEKEDFLFARLEFERALLEDPGHPEAQRLLKETIEKQEAKQNELEQSLLQQGRDQAQAEQENSYVNQKFDEGVVSLEKGNYRSAIETWQGALSKYPDNEQLKKYIENAEIELENEVNRQVAASRQLVAQEKIAEAYQMLESVKSQTIPETGLRQKVDREIQSLDKKLNFLTNYQAGLQRYSQGEYAESVPFFKKALEYNPDHKRAIELYRNAVARSTPIEQKEIKGDVQPLFNEGIQLYRDGRYEEALKVWEKALEMDPTDVTILKAIEGVQRKLQTYKNK